MINNFNPYLTAIVGANTDIQLMTSGNDGLAVINYICNYITKNSANIDSMKLFLKIARQKTKNVPLPLVTNLSASQNVARSLFIRFTSELTNCTQIALNEISTKLLGLKMCYSGSEFCNLNLYSVHRALQKYKELKEEHDILDMDFSESIRITLQLSVLFNAVENYIFRDISLEDTSWYEFSSYFSVEQRTDYTHFPHNSDHRFYNRGGMSLNSKEKVPVIAGLVPKAPDESSTDLEITHYHETMHLLFKPWRTFEHIISASSNLDGYNELALDHIRNFEFLRRSNDEAKRQAEKDKLEIHDTDDEQEFEPDIEFPKNLTKTECSDLLEKFSIEDLHQVKGIELDSKNQILNELFSLKISSQSLRNVVDPIIHYSTSWSQLRIQQDDTEETIFRTVKPLTSSHKILQNQTLITEFIKVFSLNKKQSRIFRIICTHSLQLTKKQMKIYVGGEGGTGKSRIIHSLTDYYSKLGIGNIKIYD